MLCNITMLYGKLVSRLNHFSVQNQPIPTKTDTRNTAVKIPTFQNFFPEL